MVQLRQLQEAIPLAAPRIASAAAVRVQDTINRLLDASAGTHLPVDVASIAKLLLEPSQPPIRHLLHGCPRAVPPENLHAAVSTLPAAVLQRLLQEISPPHDVQVALPSLGLTPDPTSTPTPIPTPDLHDDKAALRAHSWVDEGLREALQAISKPLLVTALTLHICSQCSQCSQCSSGHVSIPSPTKSLLLVLTSTRSQPHN